MRSFTIPTNTQIGFMVMFNEILQLSKEQNFVSETIYTVFMKSILMQKLPLWHQLCSLIPSFPIKDMEYRSISHSR